MTYKGIHLSYTVVRSNPATEQPLPYLLDRYGNRHLQLVSPTHGRSFVVGKTDHGRYIVSKGNGLSYSQHTFLFTPEMGCDTWGLLLKQDAIRDFTVGIEIETLGVKTNHMEYVLELNQEITLPTLDGNKVVKPVLLQYDVECPYRICDAPFMERSQIMDEVDKWPHTHNLHYLDAADILIRNLRTLHDHNILHNAISNQNYTWALELLDFELAHTPNYPYQQEDYIRHVPNLFHREIIQTYEIINYIAGILREPVDYTVVDHLFLDYGYDLAQYAINTRNFKQLLS